MSELFSPPGAGQMARLHPIPPAVLAGEGSTVLVGEAARALGESAFLVTYPPGRTTAAGGPEAVRASLEGSGLAVAVHEIAADPEVADVDAAAAACRESGARFVVGVGGGGPMDAAKAVAILATNGGSIHDFHLGRAVERPPLAVVAVPTTIGTGSEANGVAVIRNRALGVVKSVRDPGTVPRVAVLDPALVASLPTRLRRFGAFDGLAHGIEAFLSPNATAFTAAFSEQGATEIVRALRGDGDPLGAAASRQGLMIGSFLAGLGLQAGPGLAHVLAQPITAATGIPHAQAITALLPHTLGWNEARSSHPGFRRLAALVDPAAPSLTEAVVRLRAAAGVAVTLGELGAGREHYEAVLEAVRRSTGHIWTNVVPLSLDDVGRVLEAALAAVPGPGGANEKEAGQ